MNPNFSNLDSLLTGLNSLSESQAQQPRLWQPAMQMSIGQQALQQPIRHAQQYGPALFNTVVSNQAKPAPPTQQSLFFQNYINPADALKNQAATAVNMKTVAQSVDQFPSASRCHVFPPLLIRYHDPKNPADVFLPVEVLAMAEIHRTDNVPDVILNFHADTRAITLTLCDINPKKLDVLGMFISVVYSLADADETQTVDIAQFTTRYDQARYAYLKNLVPLSGKSSDKK